MNTRLKILFFCITCFCFIGCDRVTKDLAKEHLMFQPSISYFHDVFRLVYVENTGAAMSMGANLPQPYNFWLLGIIPLILLVSLFVYVLWKSNDLTPVKLLSFSLIIAGGLGNIIDRIAFDRHVTDFMNLGIQNLRTGIFNVADVCVTSGAIGLLLFYRSKKNTPEPVTNNQES